MTLPVVPSIVIQSPSLSTLPSIVAVRLRRSITIASKPATHGRPMPRATTAACDVAPPRAVRMPFAAIMPCTSSGAVSMRTRITSSPALPRSAALSASKTIWPVAAPGDALRPLPAMRVLLVRVDPRVEQLVERRRVDAPHRFVACR